MHFLQDPQKAYIFYPNSFLYVLPKKISNKHLMATHDYYFMFKTFFSQVNNKEIFFGENYTKTKTSPCEWCESTAAHQTAEQYSRTGKAKLQKDLRRSDRSWNTCQGFLTIPSLWSASLENRETASQGYLSIKRHSQLTRSADSFSTASSRVNGVDWEWTVRDLETIFSLIFIKFHSRTGHTTY